VGKSGNYATAKDEVIRTVQDLRLMGKYMLPSALGGTKKRQQKDIALAGECWRDYKPRKRSDPWR
jgi:hypothetical protein